MGETIAIKPKALWLVFVIIGGLAAFRIIGSFGLLSSRADNPNLVEARARVFNTEVTRRGRYPQFRATISFPLADGGSHETTTRILLPWQDELTIYYDPENPSVVVSSFEMSLGPMYPFIPVILIFGIVALGVRVLRKRVRPHSG